MYPLAAGDSGFEVQPRQPDGLEQPLAHIVHVRHARDTLDDDPEQRIGEIRVMEAGAGREHHLGLLERLEELVGRHKAQGEP